MFATAKVIENTVNPLQKMSVSRGNLLGHEASLYCSTRGFLLSDQNQIDQNYHRSTAGIPVQYYVVSSLTRKKPVHPELSSIAGLECTPPKDDRHAHRLQAQWAEVDQNADRLAVCAALLARAAAAPETRSKGKVRRLIVYDSNSGSYPTRLDASLRTCWFSNQMNQKLACCLH